MSAQFNVRGANPASVDLLSAALGLPRFIATTLVARGIDTLPAAQKFFHPSLDRDWLNPYIIPGLEEVADDLERALRQQRHILVFGDFDLDGISATTVLTRGLRELGGTVTPFIPRRFDEGYGLSVAAFERALERDPDIELIVTVDCGIACREAVSAIRARGVDVLITDHHEPADLVPLDVPVADPKMDEECPSDILAGVGVACKLLQALGGRMGKPHLWRSFVDFAAMGTVADLMPMRDENRALVSEGLAVINSAPRPCIAALLGTSGAADKAVTATNLSFSLVPRLNAAGRMGDAELALRLLMTDDFDEACKLAGELEEMNDLRRKIESELSEVASDKAEAVYRGQRALVVWGEGWHEGVKGIVASRLVSKYGVPSLLFSIDGDEARGSGRSVGRVNLFKAVESCQDLLTRFGGHDAAVGVTLPKENLPAFNSRLCAYMAALEPEDFCPRLDIDALVDLSDLSLSAVEALDTLAPFGQENLQPVFLARNVMLSGCRAVGADKNHFSCSLTNGRVSVSGIMFHCADIDKLMATDTVVDAAFQLQIDEWRGRRTVKAMLKSIMPVRMCSCLAACLNDESVQFVSDLYESADAELGEDFAHCMGAIRAEELGREMRRDHWSRYASAEPAALRDAIVESIIGSGRLHESQLRALDYLEHDLSTLAIMATGRGKSLIFQVHAATRALQRGEASLFVYPLRALIADQAFYISRSLEPFGVKAARLTGESTPEERMAIAKGLALGQIDIILTTPEYLCFHAAELARMRRFSFVVIDESHHIGGARAGNRAAYARIGEAISSFGNPVVLALTATATDGVAGDILETLPIEKCVFDEASRDNLIIDDQRNLRNRDGYLANIVASGEKTVVYVNSREQSIALARQLRRRLPHMAPLIGFYNAGLTRDQRMQIERLFRSGALTVLVSTSAFGEGVNIPNIRHVVLYHLPFNEIEFNQMAGRAGRDGNPAIIHLLFGRNDIQINQRILADMTPDHDVMAQVYRRLRQMQRERTGQSFGVEADELARSASDRSHEVTPASVECGVAVFGELGLIDAQTTYTMGRMTRTVRVCEGANRVELTDSVRYREGLDERRVFDDFCEWALRSDGSTLRVRISRPIVPEDRPDTHEGGEVDE